MEKPEESVNARRNSWKDRIFKNVIHSSYEEFTRKYVQSYKLLIKTVAY